MDIGVKCEYKGDGSREIEINFGNIKTKVSTDQKYFDDNINGGYCYLDVPSDSQSILIKHHLICLTRENNPELFGIVKDLLFKDVNLKTRSVETLKPEALRKIVQNDSHIKTLFSDNDFRQSFGSGHQKSRKGKV